jgi:mannose-6-phosphate isomerase-like protein (cupin superfamily)
MPIMHGDMNGHPAWCELEQFAIVPLATGDKHTWHATHQANKLVLVEGRCRINDHALSAGGSLDVPAGDWVVVGEGPATVVELGGHWGDDQGGAGIFGVSRADQLGDAGDPVSYPKHTTFDRHYHDCDEYWLIFEGRALLSVGSRTYTVEAGDIVCTETGVEHDIVAVAEPLGAFWFEGRTPPGGRVGHLHRTPEDAAGHDAPPSVEGWS